MLNIEARTDGITKASLSDPNVTLGDGPNSLFHEGGTALVIHEKADDYKTDPAGNSGARIACEIIGPKQGTFAIEENGEIKHAAMARRLGHTSLYPA